VISFNHQLRTGFSNEDIATPQRILSQLHDNIGGRDA
jgi:hypothetical protein